MDNFSKTCAAIILLLSLAAGAVALDARAEDYTPEETAQEEQEQAPSIDTSGYVPVSYTHLKPLIITFITLRKLLMLSPHVIRR